MSQTHQGYYALQHICIFFWQTCIKHYSATLILIQTRRIKQTTPAVSSLHSSFPQSFGKKSHSITGLKTEARCKDNLSVQHVEELVGWSSGSHASFEITPTLTQMPLVSSTNGMISSKKTNVSQSSPTVVETGVSVAQLFMQ